MITVPEQKGRVVKVQIDSDTSIEEQLLFKPEHWRLSELGICTQESLITIQPDGKALISIQNFQGTSVRLKEGEQLGEARGSSAFFYPVG